MTRVIAGSAGGRRLAVPPGTGTRPTSDRAREGMFSTWEALLGTLDGIRVADLYAGSGAVGLEALSRGAAHALLVEADAKAARTVRDNIRNFGLPGAEFRRQGGTDRDGAGIFRTVRRGFPRSAVRRHDDDLREILLTLRAQGWLTGDALVTVERSTRGGEFNWPEGFEPQRSRRYGEATFWYGRAASTCEDAR